MERSLNEFHNEQPREEKIDNDKTSVSSYPIRICVAPGGGGYGVGVVSSVPIFESV